MSKKKEPVKKAGKKVLIQCTGCSAKTNVELKEGETREEAAIRIGWKAGVSIHCGCKAVEAKAAPAPVVAKDEPAGPSDGD